MSQSQAEAGGNAPEPARKPAGREALVVALAALGLVGGVLWWALTPPANRPDGPSEPTGGLVPGDSYAGARSCRDCHPGVYASYTESGHARTLRPAERRALARWLDGRSGEDPEHPGSTWTYRLDGDRLVASHPEGGTTEPELLQFAFGSGHHATTFLTITNPDPVYTTAREHRLTYYAHRDGLGITPGQEQDIDGPAPGTTVLGRDLTPHLTHKCFDCHVTRTSLHGPSELDLQSMIPSVTCERCHGPARHHVEAARAGRTDLTMPFGPDSWTADSQMMLCGHCHRHPSIAPPGTIRPDNDELARFQPIGLMQSACYRSSQGHLSCVHCHDPHAPASSDPAHYEAACLACHEPGTESKACPVSPSEGCIGCHMPRRDAGQGILFTDHWIRIRPETRADGP